MDTRPADYLQHRLMRFADAIDETKEHFSELSPFGRYPACSPYYERSGILLLLDSMNADCDTCDNLMQEFCTVDRKLKELEEELGADYRHRLRQELSAYTERYHSAVCHANIGRVDFDIDHELFCRDRITILVHELERDQDLSEIKNLLQMLDRNLFYPKGQRDGGALTRTLMTTDREHSPSDMDRIEG